MSGHPLRRSAAATVLLLAATVAGCSEDSDDSPEPAASEPSATPSDAVASATESPSPTSSPKPVLPKAPPAKDNDAGRQAFAELVVERWGYALRTNDATALTELSPQAGLCQGCAELRSELRQRSKQGWYVDFPGAKVVKVDVAPTDDPTDDPGTHLARATINVPASESKFEDGAVRNENEARKGATFEVRMLLNGKRYSLLAFSVR